MTCCGLYFGTPSSQPDCLLATPITRNSLAWPYFPYTTPPPPNVKRMVYVRLYSQNAYTNAIELYIYVSAPLVSGQFPATPVQLTSFGISGNWTSGPNGMYKTGVFAFTPTQAQVTNGVCFLAKASPMGLAGCVCPSGFTNLMVNPLCAVFDRPW